MTEYEGMKVTIMGLGLHGGGLASARFFIEEGAEVTVTDLRDEKILGPSIRKLTPFPVRFVLGRHEMSDFSEADIVVKNPAVPASSPYLKTAARVESDISIFLRHNNRPIIAVTGSKGKSTVVSAMFHAIQVRYPEARLGGNITVSPLTFIDECRTESDAPVILELSSWQLADLRGKGLLKPVVSLITNIMHDHQNSYDSMEAYVADKKIIYADQTKEAYTVINGDDPWSAEFASETPAKPIPFFRDENAARGVSAWLAEDGSGWYRDTSGKEKILPAHIAICGEHNRLNLLSAALVLKLFGITGSDIKERLAGFRGIPHRLELLTEKRQVRWYNDSASTIPEATAVAVKSFSAPLILITGGTDKNLDFSPLESYAAVPKKMILLEGSASDKMADILKSRDLPFSGPFGSLKEAVRCAEEEAAPGDVVLFSPGATSFGMFLNEFDRGDQFKALVGSL